MLLVASMRFSCYPLLAGCITDNKCIAGENKMSVCFDKESVVFLQGREHSNTAVQHNTTYNEQDERLAMRQFNSLRMQTISDTVFHN